MVYMEIKKVKWSNLSHSWFRDLLSFLTVDRVLTILMVFILLTYPFKCFGDRLAELNNYNIFDISYSIIKIAYWLDNIYSQNQDTNFKLEL